MSDTCDVLGVDPSSTSTGIALVRHEGAEADPIDIRAFETDKKRPIQINMAGLVQELNAVCGEIAKEPDLMVVEKVSVSWNVNTIRKIAYFEAAAMLQAAYWSIPVVQVQATKARRIALGKGTLKKEDCARIVRKQFPLDGKSFAWGSGKVMMDKTDAFVLALAGPTLLSEQTMRRQR